MTGRCEMGLGWTRATVAGLAATAALAADRPALAQCRLQLQAAIPVTMMGRKPTMKAKIDGQDAVFVIDSGAFYSTLSPAAAQRLGLKAADLRRSIQGVGGKVAARLAKVHRFEFAGQTVADLDFIVASGGGGGLDGLLGENILGAGDVEYDLAQGVVRLFQPSGCGDADLAYWAGGSAARSTLKHTARRPGLLSDDSRHVVAEGAVNGHKIAIALDTGAMRSILTESAAARAGVTPAAPGAGPEGLTSGIGPVATQVWRAPFQSFAIGSEEVLNPVLAFADIPLPGADMLLGADFFLSHRIYVANSQKRVYFTRNAGSAIRSGLSAGAPLP